MDAAELGQVLAGDDAELCRERLEQHRRETGEDDDPEQVVAVARAALDIGGEIAGIHIGDRGDEGRPEERYERREPASPARQRLAAGADAALRQTCRRDRWI